MTLAPIPDPPPADLYSTRNLIANGRFSQAPTDPQSGWEMSGTERTAPSWRRIDVVEAGRNAVPLSAHAAVLTTPLGSAITRMVQTVAIDGLSTQRFAIRVSARGNVADAEATLAVMIDDTPVGSIVVCHLPLRLSTQWRRYRAEFVLPEGVATPYIKVELRAPGRTGNSLIVTDVRLVGLLRPAESIAVRFDTRGDLWLASSRLRAFLLEDYLNLLGCRTSLNEGRRFDLYVCQKVPRWPTLLAAKLARKVVVFDLDDNELLDSALRAFSIRTFSRLADGVTVGSGFLRDMAREWNGRTFLLENPVDVLAPESGCSDRPWSERLVWFGNPENRWMLDRLDLDRPVTTITRGGDIEYNLHTIDDDLTSFDLALLPVPLNDETLAKNANRLVKCVALGLPFLASDTTEHRRALKILQLPDEFLVPTDDAWRDRIGSIACGYARYRGLVEAARRHAYDVYGVERIAADWLQFCSALLHSRAVR